ncbi:hypothetical protein [Chryseolinea sp. H1M3-3]|jgi:hypothetical protein|uniref:hypothetical protein n=1 Tax=Chryseolinea sp. H1M3-3 TaxID=3034144 RepID=UPI0023ECB100|nr:hypothetical protein [Chryseolinea sp. H1M3-3]
MKTNNDLQKQVPVAESVVENNLVKKATEPITSVIPSINRFIDDIRTGYRSGSRLDVQFDWTTGRMAISHSL